MSYKDHINHQQLRMFIPAGELMDPKQYNVHSFEHLEGESTKELQARKLEEAKQPYTTDTGENPHGGGLWNSLNSGAQIEEPIRLVGQADLKEQEGEGLIQMREGANPQALVRDGHHRIAAANDIDPNTEVPVQWERNIHWIHDDWGRPDDPPPSAKTMFDPFRDEGVWSAGHNSRIVPTRDVHGEPTTDNRWQHQQYNRYNDSWDNTSPDMSEDEAGQFLLDNKDNFPKVFRKFLR
jgi:hypothetical protein